MGINKENPCLKYNCSQCCNPVKIDSRKILDLKKLPFSETGEVVVPEGHPESVKLRTYKCSNFDSKNGLCKDYENRPEICRNTKCDAFDSDDDVKQKNAIEKNKSEKFIKIYP